MEKASALGEMIARVVVITGGSSGIGRCTAALFARHGWRVGLIARGAEGLAATRRDVEAAGVRAATAEADVTNSAELVGAANAIVAVLGPVDVWINCAGNGVYGRFPDVPEAEFQRVTDVTYHGTVNGARVALAHMRPRGAGRIINVCSPIAFHGLPLMSSYAGAKAAVRAFSQALQGELRLEHSDIRVTTVFPPAVNTPYFSHATSHMGWPARPVGPVYQPEVIAQGIWQAVALDRPEVNIGGAAAVFALATRLTPWLIAWCVGRLGFERQSTRDRDACVLHEPNLFVPSQRVFGARGPFGRGARSWSMHVGLGWALAIARQFLKPALRRPARPRAVPLRSTPAQAEPDRALGDLAAQSGDV